MAERGVIDLDTPISTYNSDLPEHWRDLTLRQLHSHTAGIVGYEENFDLAGLIDSYILHRHFDDVADTLAAFDGASLLFAPGTEFHYSSYDVNLAAAVLQFATGTPFLDLMQAEVFDPTGMLQTQADDAAQSLPARAVSYKRRGNRVEPWRDVDLSIKYPGGGFLSTSSDLVRLGMAWLDEDYLRETTTNTFWTPQILSNGDINEQSYAIGWRSTQSFSEHLGREFRYIHHGGVSKGAMSWLVVFPDLDIVVALNTNARADTFGDFIKPSRDLWKLFHDARPKYKSETP